MADESPGVSAESAADTAGELLAAAAALDSPAQAGPTGPNGLASPAGVASPPADGEAEDVLAGFPPHARGLLRLRLPVTVTLASQRKSVQEITELGPGAIVKFDKTCDEPLELLVGNRLIATGEVVKVGDKFGLRVGRLQKST